jgi:uncharacterized protein YndB with AHSA1/START domain
MNATIQSVWASLIAAPLWTTWFPSATRVTLPEGHEHLELGLRFTWSQAGFFLHTKVREFTPFRRLSWIAKSPWIEAFHTWDLEPTVSGCSVVTDETQRGLMPSLFGFAVKPQMLALHDRW